MARAWPPIVFIAVSIGSLFVLRGTSGGWRPGFAIAGIVLLVGALAAGLWLALRPQQGPRHRALYVALGAMVLWYVLLAAAASLAGGEYVIAALLGATIPVTALALMVATIRRKTAQTHEGHYVDTSADDSDDPLPGIGMDDATPPGESAELHDLEREDPPARRFAPRAHHGANDQ
jgi:hypothetical protein